MFDKVLLLTHLLHYHNYLNYNQRVIKSTRASTPCQSASQCPPVDCRNVHKNKFRSTESCRGRCWVRVATSRPTKNQCKSVHRRRRRLRTWRDTGQEFARRRYLGPSMDFRQTMKKLDLVELSSRRLGGCVRFECLLRLPVTCVWPICPDSPSDYVKD